MRKWEECLGVGTIHRGWVPVGATDIEAMLSRERGQADRKYALLAALVAVLDADTAVISSQAPGEESKAYRVQGQVRKGVILRQAESCCIAARSAKPQYRLTCGM
jgi:hypothetical protein